MTDAVNKMNNDLICLNEPLQGHCACWLTVDVCVCVWVCVFALQHSESHQVCKESYGQSGEDVPGQIPVCEKRKEDRSVLTWT